MKKKKDLFVCWANVQRSQIAEAFVKKLWKNVISCASVENKREKYKNKPEKIVTNLMQENFWIDISYQKVSYPIDIIDELNNLENIYFLFDPKKAKKVDDELLINWKTFWNYLDFIWKKYSIYEIKDLDEDINTSDSMLEIIYDIDKLIKKLYLSK